MMVNGKTLEQCFKELREFKGNSRKKDMGSRSFDYYPVEEYVRAFNEVIGAENYSVDYSELTYVKIGSGQDMFTCKCTITLYGDDGLPVLHKEGYGGTEFSYQKEGGRDGNIANEPHNATTSAFKSAAKWFGVFGTYADASDSKPSGKASAGKNKADKKKPDNKKPDINISVHTKGKFFSERQDDRTKKDIWKVKALLASDNSECELVFYPNQYGKNEEKFNRLMAASEEKSVLLRIAVSDCGNREDVRQFVFKDYLPAA